MEDFLLSRHSVAGAAPRSPRWASIGAAATMGITIAANRGLSLVCNETGKRLQTRSGPCAFVPLIGNGWK